MLLLLLLRAQAETLQGAITVQGPGPWQPIQHAQPVGDLDGDGLGDLVLAVPEDDTNGDEAGAVYFVYDVAGLDPAVPLGDQSFRMVGEEPQDNAGRDVARLGDTDSDGYPDVAIAAPEASWDQVQAGKVYVVYGPQVDQDGYLGDLPYIHGVESMDRVGAALFGAPDLDGDGRTELLLGVPYSNPSGDAGPGWLALLYGRDSRWPDDTRIDLDYDRDTRETTADAAWVANGQLSFGGRAATIGPDLDGDGLAEVVVGAPGFRLPTAPDDPNYTSPGAQAEPGAILVFAGKTREEYQAYEVQDENDAFATISGSDSVNSLPWILDTLPDGRIVASTPEAESNRGAVLVFDLGALGAGDHLHSDATLRWDGDTVGDAMGHGLAVTWGFDGGSLVAVGEPGWDQGRGRVRLLGEDGFDRSLEGCGYGDETGHSVRSAPGPDPWGSDAGWIAISAPGNGFWEGEAGRAYVVGASNLGSLGQPCDQADAGGEVDQDQDGSPQGEDCDDTVAWVSPEAWEVCGNGADDDCDGSADEDCGGAPAARCGTTGAGAMSGGLVGLAVLLTRRRRRAGAALLLALSLPARAQDRAARDGMGAAFARLWGSAAWEYLRGPVVSGDFDGDGIHDVAVANYHGAALYYVAGEVQLLPGASLGGDMDLGAAPVSLHGGSEHDYLGVSVAVMRDDDGPDDLVVGADHSGLTELEQGQALRFDDPLLESGWVAAELADLVARGDDDADWLGHQVVEVGDLDGDGAADFALAAPMRDWDEEQDEAGRVWVSFGGFRVGTGAANVPEVAESFISGTVAKTHLGWRVCGPGDLDGDGRDDLVVGAFNSDEVNGGDLLVYTRVPRDTELFVSDSVGQWSAALPEQYAGYGLGCGDLNDDGLGEVVVGAPFADEGAGRVWVVEGAPNGTQLLENDARNSLGGNPGSWLGYSVAVGPRVLLGAPGLDEVWVTNGDLDVESVIAGPGFLGATVSWLDDLDGDAVKDVALVASDATGTRENQGVALLISGAPVINGSLPAAPDVADFDGDGAVAGEDCDDGDPRRRPGGEEICGDAVDNNCDGAVDEEACVGGRGCSTAGGWVRLWAALAGILAVLARRRAWLWALPLALSCGGGAPALQLEVPSGPLYGTVELSALGNFDRLAILVDGEVVGGGDGPSLSVLWDTTTVADGAHLVRGVGYLGAEEPVEVVREVEVSQVAGDLSAPAVRFDAPVAGGVYEPDAIAVIVEVSEDVGLESAELYADETFLLAWPPQGPFEAVWKQVPDGPHTLTARVMDLAGKPGEASVEIEVSSLAQVDCTVTRPDEGDTVSGTVNVTVAASSQAGISTVEFFANDVSFGVDDASSWQYEWDSTPYDGQTVALSALCTGADGNSAWATPVNVTVDSDAGGFSVTITQPSDGGTVSGTAARVKAAVGGGKGAAGADFYVDDVWMLSLTASPWEFLWDTTALENGSHVVKVVGTEAVTGATAEDSITVTVAN